MKSLQKCVMLGAVILFFFSLLLLPWPAVAAEEDNSFFLASDGQRHSVSLYMESDSLKFKKNNLEKIKISLSTQNDFINAVQAVIYYNPEKVAVKGIKIENSFCNPGLFLEKSIDNKAGEVRVVCGLFNPGFSGDGIVAELEIVALKNDPVVFNFSSESMALANDGLGTNVLSFMYDSFSPVVD
jgi:hypothetical protein